MSSFDNNIEVENNLKTLANEEDQIGHIVSGENGISISLEEDALIECFVNIQSRDSLPIGSYIQIPLITNQSEHNKEILGIVTDLRYDSKTKSNEYTSNPTKSPQDEELEKSHAMIAKIDPIAIIEKDENGKPNEAKTVATIPKPYTKTYKTKNREMLRKGLNIPKNGVPVGFLSNNGIETPKDSPLLYKLNNPGKDEEGESFLWRHSLICGSTGTGKTYASKNIIKQVHGSKTKYETPTSDNTSPEPNIIIIDPEGEYKEMRDDPNLSGEQNSIKRKLESKGVEIGGVNNNLQVYRPEHKGKDDNKSAGEEESFHISFKFVRNRENLLLPFDAKMPTRDAIGKIITKFFQDYSGKKTYENFIYWLKEGEFDGEEYREKHKINESAWDAAISRLENDTFGSIFDQSDKSLQDKARNIIQPGQISVIPVKHLTDSQQKLVVMSIMSLIADNKLETGKKHDKDEVKERIDKTPIVLALDEAHNYLSSNADNKVRDKFIMDKFINIAKQGRKYKTGLLMITQNPEDIHQEIMKQTNTRFYMRLEGEILKNLNESEEIKRKVKKFDKGQMMIKSPGTRPVEVKGFKICTVKHSN